MQVQCFIDCYDIYATHFDESDDQLANNLPFTIFQQVTSHDKIQQKYIQELNNSVTHLNRDLWNYQNFPNIVKTFRQNMPPKIWKDTHISPDINLHSYMFYNQDHIQKSGGGCCVVCLCTIPYNKLHFVNKTAQCPTCKQKMIISYNVLHKYNNPRIQLINIHYMLMYKHKKIQYIIDSN